LADVPASKGRLVRDFLGRLYGLAVQSLDLALPVDNLICSRWAIIGQPSTTSEPARTNSRFNSCTAMGKSTDNLRHVRADFT